ncbi:MAG: response regulator [Deltaproteobacteria bacterium]|nr:response regulator [Deltaproteobacteria bacterium]
MDEDFKPGNRPDKEDLVKRIEALKASMLSRDWVDASEDLRLHQLELEMQNLDLIEAQRQLEEARDRYAELFDFAPLGYIVFDSKGIITEANLAAAALMGSDSERSIGKPFVRFVDSMDRRNFLSHLRRCVSGELKVTTELSIRVKGAAVPVQLLSMPAVTHGGQLTFRTAVMDLTERKRSEHEKERIQASLMQSQKMETIGRLASGIAHDFNNIMTIINSYAALAASGGEASLSDCLEQISAASDRAKILTRQLLIFSRVNPEEPVVLDINEVLNDTGRMLGRILGENITVSESRGGGLWQVLADRGNIAQVVLNLAMNAKDAMIEGGRVAINTENVTLPEGPGQRRFVCVRFKDSGTGMSEHVKANLFEPFFTTKEAGRGIGLGLTVINNIIKDCNGRVEFSSCTGEGTEFRIYFPACEGKSEGAPVRKENEKPYAGNGERVLVVEDEKWLRKGVALVLQANGYQVFEAEDAEEAVELFEKEGGRFDLLFTDVVLKGKSGIQLVEDLSSRERVNVLFTSGYMDAESQWPMIREKGYRFLQKPYEIADLLKILRESLMKYPGA